MELINLKINDIYRLLLSCIVTFLLIFSIWHLYFNFRTTKSFQITDISVVFSSIVIFYLYNYISKKNPSKILIIMILGAFYGSVVMLLNIIFRFSNNICLLLFIPLLLCMVFMTILAILKYHNF
jgi:hypothetical protein